MLPLSSRPDGGSQLPSSQRRRRARLKFGSIVAMFILLAFGIASLGARHIDQANAGPTELTPSQLHPGDAAARRRATSKEAEYTGQDEVIEIHLEFVHMDPMTLRIRLRPDYSPSSAAFWHAAALAKCGGNFYRSEGFLMQGRVECANLKQPIKGVCPPDAKLDASRKCPEHDPNCGCHGPLMERGMVGWAGGGVGPDFFVYTGTATATHWQHDHTVFGQIADESSWEALEEMRKLSVLPGQMTMLVKPVDIKVTTIRDSSFSE